jgi:histidinol phosphatase-like PHP family hydrolase
MITEEDARLAAKKEVCLEVTTRKGHSETNSHVAKVAKKNCAKIIINSDSHGPEDIPDQQLFSSMAKAAGLSPDDTMMAYENSKKFLRELFP